MDQTMPAPTRPTGDGSPDRPAFLGDRVDRFPLERVSGLIEDLEAAAGRLVDDPADRESLAEAYDTAAAHARLLARLARAALCPVCDDFAAPDAHLYCAWRAEALQGAAVAR